MPARSLSQNSGEARPAERLIAATLRAWENHGSAMMSARNLAQDADLPASGIYHHFGDMKHLYLSAQSAAQAAAERWCAAHLEAVAGAGPMSPTAFPPLLAALIDDWSHDQRQLAFAWRECQLLAARDADYVPALIAWQELWQNFWRGMCGQCGLSEAGEATSLIFDGESLLHLMRWQRAVDRACLDELCRGWGDWLAGNLAAEGPWRRHAREAAAEQAPQLSLRDDITRQIADAAADTVEHLGMAGLTHRAVAQQAGVTLGLVSYNFRTGADLARAAFEAIYLRTVSGLGTPPPRTYDPRGAADTLFEHQTTTVQRFAIEELMVAVARDANLRAFAPQLRYLRGRTSGVFLQARLGEDRPASPLDAALFSGLMSALGRACIGRPPAQHRAFARQSFEALPVLRIER